MNKKTSLIAGSTGFLGSKILNFLYKEDQKIYCLSRRDNEIELSPWEIGGVLDATQVESNEHEELDPQDAVELLESNNLI